MDEFFRRAPRNMLALGVIVIGFALIIGFNPPRTICDEQIDVFRESQKSFLQPEGVKVEKSPATELFELCKSDNGPGGCFDYFLKMRSMVDGLERIPKSCASTVADDATIKSWLLKSLALMSQIAWGESSAGVYTSRKHSWLDTADLRLFCRMKAMASRLYGAEGFQTFRESVMADLPGGEKLTREQRWTRSIFSSPCD